MRRELALFILLVFSCPSFAQNIPTQTSHNAYEERRENLIRHATNPYENRDVRVSAIYLLREYAMNDDDGRARRVLRNLAESDNSPAVRLWSYRSLGRATRFPDIVDFLRDRTTRESDWYVLEEIYRALSRVVQDDSLTFHLLNQLRKETDARKKEWIVKSLFYPVKNDDRSAVSALKSFLEDPNPSLRVAAFRILNQDCDYFLQWICPEKRQATCQQKNPWDSGLYCP